MSETLLKPGDRVRINDSAKFSKGEEGTVNSVELLQDSTRFWVSREGVVRLSWFHAHELDLLPGPPQPKQAEDIGVTEEEVSLWREMAREIKQQPSANGQLDIVLAERGARYGRFEDHARISQTLKQVMAGTVGWDRLDPPQREALEMIAHKIGRILNGDPNYSDSWMDIGGYAKLEADLLEGVSR